ncbi:hypothetical protein GCM10008927_22580 [Amylibacter ulvae]|uniref:Uncharacterized protein n=1 Tax=Paramylibacter ulvae TaxID=1651968 RepID=A0ABQ3D338_9RHOB|nr:hypothetical protein [Amylibacter ulvae]GHA56313.1 hypothetical protein GCM10008927_22580 [Amylibacter ulvae]
MQYDYQIVATIFFGVLGIIGALSAMVDRRSPLAGVTLMLVAAGFGYWAWVLSEGTLTMEEIPSALFRIMASILNN